MQYRVVSGILEVESDHIAILTYAKRHDDAEIVYWANDEWKEDTTLVPAIVNAVALFFTKGADAVAARVGKRIDRRGHVHRIEGSS